jgi:hypothetical protein
VIKRIAILFIITGSGYGFSVLALKFLAQHGEVGQVAGIAEVESLIQFMIGLIGFGMQTEAIRNISFSSDWKVQLQHAQTARITLSYLLMGLCVFGFRDHYFLYFIIAPFLAFSSDYALYARGLPIVGAIVALFRATVPLFCGIVAVYIFPDYLLVTYVVSTLLVYLVTNSLISYYLQAPLFYFPSFQSLKLYIKTAPLGIINLCFYFFGLGILLFAQLLFDPNELVISFMALKFYFIYKGAIRVIQQAFINRMKEEQVCLSIDKISIMMSILFLGSVVLYSHSFISLFFGKQFVDHYIFFVFMGIAAVVFSVFNSASTRSLLERRDTDLLKIAGVSVILSIVTLFVFVQFSKRVEVITVSLLLGEGLFAIGLAVFFFTWGQIKERVLYLAMCSLGLVLPYLIKTIFSESLSVYLISFTSLGLLLLLFSYKKLTLPKALTD